MTTYSIVDMHGTSQPSTLAELCARSRYTLLYFYPRDNTPGCTIEAQEFTQHIADFTKLEIQIIGVSKDSEKSHCAFVSKYHLSASYISDPELILHQQFGARGQKNMYGKITEGTIRSSVLLDSTGKIIHHWKSVRAKGHAQEVLQRAKTQLT